MPNLLTQLHNEYHASLVRLLVRRTGDRARAEELAQETLRRALQSPPANPRTWLFATALQLADRESRRTTRQGHHLHLLRRDPEAGLPDPGPDADHDDARAQVRRALMLLNDRDREALLLKSAGFNYDEIAEALGMPRIAVGSTLARARRHLAEAFRDLESGGETQYAAHE